MGRWGRIAAALAAVVTPASVFAVAGPAYALVAPTNVGNTGNSSLAYIDRQITAGPGGFAYMRSTPAYRSQAWWGFPTGASGPAALTGIPADDYMAGVQGGLAVATDFNGTVAWENVNGTGAGTGPNIPSSASTSWTADTRDFEVSPAPLGWVTVGISQADGSHHLLRISTAGAVTDLDTLPAAGGYSFKAGPNGVVFQTWTYDPATNTSTQSPWSYVAYSSPNNATALASNVTSDMCDQVLSSDAICWASTSTTPVDVLVPLNGSADTSISLPGTATYITGTPAAAAWLDLPAGTVSFQPWSGGAVTTVSTGSALPAAEMASDGTNLIFGAALNAPTAGLGEVTPPSTSVTGLSTEQVAPTEAGGLSLTPGRVSWTDDHPAGTTLASGAGPLWDRTLTNSAGTLTAGTSPNLVVTNASAYGLSYPAELSISGRRSLFVNSLNDLVVQDPSAATPQSTLGSKFGYQVSLSGSRALWFDNSAGKWKLRDLNTGTDADLSGNIGNSDFPTLWGNYIAFEKQSDDSVWRWDISNLSNPPVQVLASPRNGTTITNCNNSGGPFVSGDYVAWTEDCYDSGYTNMTLVSGYKNVTAGTAAVDLSSSGYVTALSGSYVATIQGYASPVQAQTVTATKLGTSTTTSPGSATGPVALDGSTLAWIDGVGDVQAQSLPYVPEQPRYLGNGTAPSKLTLPGTWNGEWDTSGALNTCTVNITQGATAVATLPCNAADMALGEAVVSWNGQATGGAQVASGNYTWTLNATGPDGALVAPDGKALTLTGSIAVPPNAPTGVTATAGVDSATVSWTAPTTGPAPSSYVVMSNPPTSNVGSNSTSANVTGLTAGVSYTFTVESVGAGGNSPASAASNAVVPTSVAVQNTNSGSGTDPTANTSTPSSSSPSGTMTVSASGTGNGTVNVGTYPSDPVGGFQAGATYFDVSTASSSSFTSLSFTVCGLAPKSTVSWWNPALQAWQAVSDATPVNSSGCSTVTIDSTTSPNLSQLNGTIFAVGLPSQGYTMVASDGGVFPLSGAGYFGSTGNKTLNAPIVGMAMTPDGGGYWLVASDGGVFNFGDATYYGSKGSQHLNAPIVGIASTPTGNGYWLVGADGGVFNFGDAVYYGGEGATHLNKPVVGMAADPTTGGYWLVASDGGIFNFHAPYEGSTGNRVLNKPVVGMAVDTTTGGYWLVASDGGIFNFNAPYEGSTGNRVLNKPVVGMAADPNSGGYWLFASDGGVFNFGAPYGGSLAGMHLNRPIVGGAAG